MNEFITNPTTQTVLQVLAAIGAVCLFQLFMLRTRKAYLGWRAQQDKLDKIPRDWREYVLGRLQVMIDTAQQITIKSVYEILDGPDGLRYFNQGCRLRVDPGIYGHCLVVTVYNNKWGCKLLVPVTIPTHWSESDWPLNVAILNQCREMVRIDK